jgi:endonuclease YncB( thermonuclease family)
MVLWAVLATMLSAETIEGKVVGITDGDTLTVLTPDKRQIKVRLAEIDTPEKKQPYGTKARQSLADICFGKHARLSEHLTDRYGRTVARVYCDGVDANAEQVRRGAAWVYRQYAKDQSLFVLEEEARKAKRGLWALQEANIPPWEWRHGGHPTQATKTSTDGQFTCGAKRYCKEMTSCAEARFYLEHCGLKRLDSDHDGVPCETLCR